MVEVPCYLRKWGPEPVTIGNIPQFQLGMMMQQVSSEKLIAVSYTHLAVFPRPWIPA